MNKPVQILHLTPIGLNPVTVLAEVKILMLDTEISFKGTAVECYHNLGTNELHLSIKLGDT